MHIALMVNNYRMILAQTSGAVIIRLVRKFFLSKIYTTLPSRLQTYSTYYTVHMWGGGVISKSVPVGLPSA
jgi:hypothetical protein